MLAGGGLAAGALAENWKDKFGARRADRWL